MIIVPQESIRRNASNHHLDAFPLDSSWLLHFLFFPEKKVFHLFADDREEYQPQPWNGAVGIINFQREKKKKKRAPLKEKRFSGRLFYHREGPEHGK